MRYQRSRFVYNKNIDRTQINETVHRGKISAPIETIKTIVRGKNMFEKVRFGRAIVLLNII